MELMTEDPAWMKIIPRPPLTATNDKVINELVEIWQKAQLPYIFNERAKALLSKLYDEFSKDRVSTKFIYSFSRAFQGLFQFF